MCLFTCIVIVYAFNIHEKNVLLVSGGDVAKEHRNIKHTLSSTTASMDKHLYPNSQRELVGHSIVRPLTLHFSKICTHHGELLSYLVTGFNISLFKRTIRSNLECVWTTSYGMLLKYCYVDVIENQTYLI